MVANLNIRKVAKSEYQVLGSLMVAVYAALDGFPSPDDQPEYYKMLAKVGELNEQDHTTVLVAETTAGNILGGVVYYSDMSKYGSGGSATKEKNASGIRLLCVDPESRGLGVGKRLTLACLEKGMIDGNAQVILHTTKAMKTAWNMYERLGFERSTDLDFSQQGMAVYGFRLVLKDSGSYEINL